MEVPEAGAPSNFTAPQVLSGVAKFLQFTRFSGSTEFADLVSPNMNDQKNYTYGLVFLVTLMATILFLWASVQIVLKYHGDLVGCASGKPFETTASYNQSTAGSSASRPSTQVETLDSSSLESRTGEHSIEIETAQTPSRGTKEPYEDHTKASRRRQKRTRCVFVVSGLAVLVCTTLLLIFSFSSFQDTVDSTDEMIVASQDIVDQIKATVKSVESAVVYANETLSKTQLNLQTVCPNYTTAEELGVNIIELSAILREEFDALETVGTENITEINKTLAIVQNGIDLIRGATETTDEKLWIFPLILLIIFVTATAMLVAAVLAWTGKSSSSFERKMAYGVLPFLIIIAVVCWLLALGAAIASLVTADACVGNPDETVQSVIQKYNADTNTTSTQLMTIYANGCQGEDPTKVFSEFEADLQTAIDTIWRYISLADSIGRAELSKRCGNDVGNLLNGARDLARSLTWTRNALINAIEALKCEPINAIYVDAIHNSVCTEGGQGIAWAFILFSVVGIGAMTMVCLRASLYNHVGDDEVYDDNEVVDNMILNEHEEYLAYISKYKHEWEEYRGMNAEPFDSQSSGEISVESIVASESWTDRGDDEILVESWDVESGGPQITETDSEHDYSSIDSCETDEISFPSLHGSQRSPTNERYKGSSPIVPSLLGSPADDEPDEAWEKEPDFFLGHKDCQVTMPAAPANESQEANVEVHLSPTWNVSTKESRDEAPVTVSDAKVRDAPPISHVDFRKSSRNELSKGDSDLLRAPNKSTPNSRTGIREGLSKKIASPDVLDSLKYYDRHELPSPRAAGNIRKASEKMKLVVQNYEL